MRFPEGSKTAQHIYIRLISHSYRQAVHMLAKPFFAAYVVLSYCCLDFCCAYSLVVWDQGNS